MLYAFINICVYIFVAGTLYKPCGTHQKSQQLIVIGPVILNSGSYHFLLFRMEVISILSTILYIWKPLANRISMPYFMLLKNTYPFARLYC